MIPVDMAAVEGEIEAGLTEEPGEGPEPQISALPEELQTPVETPFLSGYDGHQARRQLP